MEEFEAEFNMVVAELAAGAAGIVEFGPPAAEAFALPEIALAEEVFRFCTSGTAPPFAIVEVRNLLRREIHFDQSLNPLNNYIKIICIVSKLIVSI